MFSGLYNRIARSGITKHPVVRSARRFVSNRLIRQPILVNKSFYMFIEEHQPLNILINKTYEPVETASVNRVLKERMVGLNIGANMGYYSLLMAQKCSKVYAVEPSLQFYKILEKNIEANKLKGKIIPYNFALGKASGNIKFKAPVGDDIMETTSVKRVKLDELFKGKPQPDIIVMDVDGAEADVLAGGRKTFANAKHVFFENNLGPKFLQQFRDMGFEVQPIDSMNFYARKGRK